MKTDSERLKKVDEILKELSQQLDSMEDVGVFTSEEVKMLPDSLLQKIAKVVERDSALVNLSLKLKETRLLYTSKKR